MRILRMSTIRQMMAVALVVAVGLIRADGVAKQTSRFSPILSSIPTGKVMTSSSSGTLSTSRR